MVTVPSPVVVLDFDGNGVPDLAVGNAFGGTLSLLTGAGDGTFRVSAVVATGGSPVSVSAGDFNGDGRLDLAAASYDGGVQVSLNSGNLQRLFGPVTNFPAGLSPWQLAAAEVDGDEKVDVVVVNNGSNSVGFWGGKGDGTFREVVNYGVGNSPVGVVIADFNGDGRADLAVVNYLDGSVSVLLGE